MKQIVLLAHCVLNSMCEDPPAPDTYRKDIVSYCVDHGISMLQLPCPELCYQDLKRSSIYPETEEAKAYADYCRDLLKPVVDNLRKYAENGIDIAGIIGIDTSPSCSTGDPHSIMLGILSEELGRIGICNIPFIDMPVSEGDKDFMEKLQKMSIITSKE